MSTSQFQYTIHGITLTAEEVREIYNAYEHFGDASKINRILKLNDMDLAKEIALYYYDDETYTYPERIWEAISSYSNAIIEEYLISHNITTQEEIEKIEDIEGEQTPMWLLEEKCQMDIKTDKNLCQELMPLYYLVQKYNEWRNN